MAVSDTAWKPSLYNALTKLSPYPLNYETYDGASDTMTLRLERKAILTLSVSFLITLTELGHSLTHIPQNVQR